MRRTFFSFAVLQGKFGAVSRANQFHSGPAAEGMADYGDARRVDPAGESVIADQCGQRSADVARPFPQWNDLGRIFFGERFAAVIRGGHDITFPNKLTGNPVQIAPASPETVRQQYERT